MSDFKVVLDKETGIAKRVPIGEYNAAPKPVDISVVSLSDDDLRKLAKEKLSHALQAVNATQQPDLAKRLAEAVLDRLDGKPTQQIHQVISKGNGVSNQMTNEQLLIEIQRHKDALPSGVKLLDDGKLVIDADYESIE